jgi:hypothetical protein
MIRLSDPSLLTSTDQQFQQWAFNVLLNQDLCHTPPTIAVRRGLEHVVGIAGVERKPVESTFNFDELDSKIKVKELCAMLSTYGQWDYFITDTCNFKESPGVRKLTEAIEEECERREDHFVDQEELAPRIKQKRMAQFCRLWERTAFYLWRWRSKSAVRPLGHIKHFWYRFEFQEKGAKGGIPHIHGGVRLVEGSEPENVTSERIVASTEHMKTAAVVQEMIENGTVESKERAEDIQDMADSFLIHDCLRGNSRCMKRVDENGEKRCRFFSMPGALDWQYVPRNNLFSEEGLDVLTTLGLTERDAQGTLQPVDLFLGGRYLCPAYSNEKCAPFIPSQVYANPASCYIKRMDPLTNG